MKDRLRLERLQTFSFRHDCSTPHDDRAGAGCNNGIARRRRVWHYRVVSKRPILAGGLVALAALAFAVAADCGRADATGTVTIQQRDGATKTYRDVGIRIRNAELVVTSSDGQGTLVIGKAACTRQSILVKCLPYDATLYQNGGKFRVALTSGTVWLNPTTTTQPLSFSSAHLQPHGVLMSVTTSRGTYVSLTGTIDGVQR